MATQEQTKVLEQSSGYSGPFREQILACFEDPYMEGTFSEVKEIGYGGYGTVFSVRNNHDGKRYALKVMPLYTVDDAEKLKTEVKVLAKISGHKNIVGYNNSWMTKCDTKLREATRLSENVEVEKTKSTNSMDEFEWTGEMFVIQMEYCKQDLKQFIEKQTPSTSKTEDILRDILAGIKYFHSQNVIHRDLKPANILLDTFGRAKIGDFGLAKVVENIDIAYLSTDEESGSEYPTHDLGTCLYRAPEMESVSGLNKYDHMVDLYSLGVIIFELIYHLNTAQERCEVLKNLREGSDFPTDFDDKVKRNAKIYKDIIRGLMNNDPSQRYSVDRVESLLLDVTDIHLSARNVPMSKSNQQIPKEIDSAVEERLAHFTDSVGFFKCEEESFSSLCFPIGKTLIITVLPKHFQPKKLHRCMVIFPRLKKNGNALRFHEKEMKVIWNSGEPSHGSTVIIQLNLGRNTDFPFDPSPTTKACLHSGEVSMFYFNESLERFTRIAPTKLSDTDINESPSSLDNMYFFRLQGESSNIGAPVLQIYEDQSIKLVGIITKSVYKNVHEIVRAFAVVTGLKPDVSPYVTLIAPNCQHCREEILSDENANLRKEIEQLKGKQNKKMKRKEIESRPRKKMKWFSGTAAYDFTLRF